MILSCKKCRRHLAPGSHFCPTCGTSQSLADDALTHQPGNGPSNTGGLPVGKLLHQRYRFLHLVGKGGMGAVYLAQDTQLGDRLIAIKEMSMSRLTPQDIPQAVDQFQQEAHLLARLHHPNLPTIYDYFGEGGRWYLAMSFIQGQTLQKYLEDAPGNVLPIKEVIQIGIALCTVLEYLHTYQPQIIFRDLKPSNVMVTPARNIYLIDFGIARHFKPGQTKDTLYQLSVGYAPPEQYGQTQTGPRSDIYSLGATMHQLLTGHDPAKQPFRFPALQLLNPAIPLPLADLIGQMLEMDEKNRPSSALVVKQCLEQLLSPSLPTQTDSVDTQDHLAMVSRTKPVLPAQQSAKKKLAAKKIQGGQGSKGALLPRLARVLFWIGFSIMVIWFGIGLNISLIDSFGNLATVDGIIAASVGLAFLLTRDRFPMSSIGGIAFTICGNIARICFFSPFLYQCAQRDTDGTCSNTLYNVYDPNQQNVLLVLTTFIIVLLLLGGYLLARHSGTALRWIWGTILIISAIPLAGVFATPLSVGITIMQVIIGILIWLRPRKWSLANISLSV